MAGYISNSKKDYYNGDYYKYFLKECVATAGGNLQQIELFNFLLSYSMESIDKTTKKKIPFYDQRAGLSLLFILPPKFQLLLSLVLYEEEVRTANLILLNPDTKNRLDYKINIKQPIEVLMLNQKITKCPIGNIILKIISEVKLQSFVENNTYDKLLNLLGIERSIIREEYCLRDKVERIFSLETVAVKDKYIDIAVNNNRLEAGVMIGLALGYTEECIRQLAAVIERWEQ